ncbi:MAG: hypothetical protein HOW71_04520 [Nonomuraea sp.]|nr:hypothetical protein [Nonomuraea sp.]NUP61424.1 hypothetical protein [Nonomuraea sp.]NUS03217.1 hypothetical protein [Nonomuraea sp.]
MNELIRWETDTGPIVVEVSDDEPGFESIARRPGEVIHDAQDKFESALISLRGAARSALEIFRDDVLKPDGVDIEFGVKLNATAGAVIAKSTVEGHLVVKLRWERGTGGSATAG